MRLQHVHLQRPISYAYSLRLQELLLERQFAYKTALRNDKSLTVPTPPPTLLTFQTQPTYTVGRRHLRDNPLSDAQIRFLTGASNDLSENQKNAEDESQLPATFFPSPRGGLLTYHAPGQLTAYLILDLRVHGLTPRCYIRLLENTVMKTCAAHGVPNVMTTEDPGVWISEDAGGEAVTEPDASQSSCERNDGTSTVASQKATSRKICAVGVHVSRGITSHGIGLNCFDSPIDGPAWLKALYTLPQQDQLNRAIPAKGYLSWGFGRIVACGLEGKSVTWLAKEQLANRAEEQAGSVASQSKRKADTINQNGGQGSDLVKAVARTLAQQAAKSLDLKTASVEQIFEEDLVGESESGQMKRDWQYLKSLSGKAEDHRNKDHVLGWAIRDLRKDSGLRFH